MKVLSDTTGLYIKHGDQKIRPVKNTQFNYVNDAYAGMWGERHGLNVCHNNQSQVRIGDDVKKKHHAGSTLATVTLADGKKELWFIQDMEPVTA